MTTTPAPSLYTALPDDQTLTDTVAALEQHGHVVLIRQTMGF